jgi:beta-glucosidase
MGAASTVLLKNVNGALPLKKPRSLVLVGSDAGPGKIGPNQFADHVRFTVFHGTDED